MAAPKKYFQDHLVLLLLSINVFLAFGAVIFILARLSGGHGSGYIAEYRSSLGIDAFRPGGISSILSFIVFAFLVLVIGVMLSLQAYRINRQVAIIVQSLTALLLVLTIIISNALLLLH